MNTVQRIDVQYYPSFKLLYVVKDGIIAHRINDEEFEHIELAPAPAEEY